MEFRFLCVVCLSQKKTVALTYSLIEKILHVVALQPTGLASLSFDLEKAAFKTDQNIEQVVYVTGLARSGTTAVMQGLYKSDAYASLTYDDMPFLLAPNFWGWLRQFFPKKQTQKERFHGDGIIVDNSSPEAFEEVFWRNKGLSIKRKQRSLDVLTVQEEMILELAVYHKLICSKYQKLRYLCKNNNHILRLASLSCKYPKSKFIVVIRNPCDQAQSSWRQHRKFSDLGVFEQKYLEWLSHYEFGDTHKPFNIRGKLMDGIMAPCQPDYWLKQWIHVHEYLLAIKRMKLKNVMFLNYEKVCTQPKVWINLCKSLDLEPTDSGLLLKSNKAEDNVRFDGELVKLSEGIYRAF